MRRRRGRLNEAHRLADAPILFRRGLFVAALLALLWPVAGLAQGHRPVVWFGPVDWLRRPQSDVKGPPDYMKLFDPASATLSQIAVFEVNPPLLIWASDAELRRIFSELRRRGVRVAFQTGGMTPSATCGRNVEGYGGKNMVHLAARVARLGGELDYIAMDEPAFYGHVYSGRSACHSQIADIARDVATNVAAVKAIFPRLQIGDIEPVHPSPDDRLTADYARWADAFRAATGTPLSFLQSDVQWKTAWREPLERLAAALRARHIPLGVIYNGNSGDASDTAWVANAEAHYRAVEDDPRIMPDQAVFMSWVSHPSHVYPDTDPGTYSYLLKEYLRARAGR
jgi:hypothetical protein